MVITSVIILLPIVFGLIMWNKLPDEVPIHWNIQGEVDKYTGKAAAVFGMPVFFLALHWISVFLTGVDPKNKNIDGKMQTMVLWICPAVSLNRCIGFRNST